MIKLCTNCYWKNKETKSIFCSYHESPIVESSCKDHSYKCCGSHKQETPAVVIYQDNAYCEDCFIKEIGVTKVPVETYDYYDNYNNYICNDSDHDVMDEIKRLGYKIEELEY